jgi:biofilm PGA synthesis N-glycosyltransferase PgaC
VIAFRHILAAIDHSLAYRVALVYFGFYPIFMAIIWVVLSVMYFRRRETKQEAAADDYAPFVSVIIPAYAEEQTIARTLEALLDVDYPDYEIIVVTDGSPDRTPEIVKSYFHRSRVRLLEKHVNEGKAMALNDALPLCRGEILVVLDADIVATPSLLHALTRHFIFPRVAAVTGNPRVENRSTLLRQLQAIEFSSIVSVQRRAQRIWGRVLTVSGAVMALRRSAIIDVGLFAPDMATEDIEITWRLQRKFWDVRYEPSAVVWMQVPPNLVQLWKQRRRWARGLAQVLRKHWDVPLHWTERRLWPIYFEAVFSIGWAFTFSFVTAYWAVSLFAGYAPYGASPFPNLWGMIIASACLIQLFTGVMMDRRYDPKMLRSFPVAIFYPLIYWTLMSTITTIYSIGAFVRRGPRLQTWRIKREDAS